MVRPFGTLPPEVIPQSCWVVQMSEDRVLRVALSLRVHALKERLAEVLSAAGHVVESPTGLAAWAGDGTDRVALVSMRTPEETAELAALHRRCPQLPIVALLEEEPPSGSFLEAHHAGATSYVERHRSVETVVGVIDGAADGRASIPAEVFKELLPRAQGGEAACLLSPAEAQLIDDTRAGMTQEAAARRAGVDVRSLHRRRKKLERRMGARSWGDALYLAGRERLCEPSSSLRDRPRNGGASFSA